VPSLARPTARMWQVLRVKALMGSLGRWRPRQGVDVKGLGNQVRIAARDAREVRLSRDNVGYARCVCRARPARANSEAMTQSHFSYAEGSFGHTFPMVRPIRHISPSPR
jgi:hypothetical protein